MTARGAAPEIPAPVGFASLITSSWWIVRAHLGTLFKLMLLFVAVDWLLFLLALAVAESDVAGFAVAFAALLPLVVRIALGGLGVAAGATVIGDALAGEPISVRKALDTCRPLLKELLAASLFGALIGMLIVFASQGAGVLFLPLFYGPPLIAQVIALEARPFQMATTRVREMGRGQLARIFGYLLSVALFIGLMVSVVPQVIAALAEGLGDAAQLASLVLASVLLSAAALAFFSAVSTVAYFDLRARFEDYGPKELKAERGS